MVGMHLLSWLARRHYSAKQFENSGTLNVVLALYHGRYLADSLILPTVQIPDQESTINTFLIFSLKETLGRLANFPNRISRKPGAKGTSTSISISHCWRKNRWCCHLWYYSEEAKYHHHDTNSIQHKEGIEVEHVLASGTFPLFYWLSQVQINIKNNNNNGEQF